VGSPYKPLVNQLGVLEGGVWTRYPGNQMHGYFGILGHVPGYVTARRGLIRKFDESQPREANGRFAGHNTPFRAAGFKHKETGFPVETGAFHDIMAIPGMNDAKEGTGMDLLDEYEQGFFTHDGTFLDRIQAAEYATTAVLPGGRKKLDSTDVKWEEEARQFKRQRVV
jgi:hypothetical protein